jgi:hypothetical protein
MRYAPAFCGWLVGLVLAFHGMIFSGFAVIPGNEGDPRFINYILEHGYRWSMGHPLHRDFWSPPFFYPAQNTAAFSDVLLSAGPFYWCWRWLGFLPDTAYQLWLLTICSLNFWACHALLRNCLRLPALASSLGAFVFAFASSRLAQIGHPQLHLHFFSILALYALFRFFQQSATPDGSSDSRLSPRVWIVIFGLAVVGQFYASFYLGWFLGIGLFVALGWALILQKLRAPLVAALRTHASAILASLLASVALLAPLAVHYYRASHEVGRHHFSSVRGWIPTCESWCYLGDDSWLYGSLSFLKPTDVPSEYLTEHCIGIGLGTTLLAAAGLLRRRQSPFVCLLLLSAAVLVVCFTLFPPGVTPWQNFRNWVPAAKGIRALSRIGLMFLIPASVGVAYAVTDWRRPLVMAAIVVVCILEQGRSMPSFDKQQTRAAVHDLARQIDPACHAFFISPQITEDQETSAPKWHIDAMWAQLESNIPTVNGYSGNGPRGWGLDNHCIRDPRHALNVENGLRAWIVRNGLREAEVHWIKCLPSP